MQEANVQDRQGRIAILTEYYSTLTRDLTAATREELIEKLMRVRDAFERLQEQYDPSWKGYETKIFMFYDDLLDKAKGFDPAELRSGAAINMPQRYTAEDFFDLNLAGYSDIVDFWDMLNNVSSTDTGELVRSLEDIRRKVNAVPEGQDLTRERVALLALVNVWLRQLGRVKALPPTVKCETTILPTKYECLLRLSMKSQDLIEYDLEVIPPSGEIKVLECQPRSVKCGPTGMAEVECRIRSEVVGKQELRLVLSSREQEEAHERKLDVEFYDLGFVKPSNPYPTLGRTSPLSFPSRESLKQKVIETIQDFVRENTSDFLVIELRGGLRSGKTILVDEICQILSSVINLRSNGSVAECKHELQKCMISDSGAVPLIRCDSADRFPNRQAIFFSLFEAGKSVGATKVIFLCELPKTEPPWSGKGECQPFPVERLTKEDIKTLIEQVGCVGGGPGDEEIRDRLSRDLPFLHFDTEVVNRIWDLAADYLGLAIQTCDKIVERCSDQKCVYVRAGMAEAAIKQVCQGERGELSKSIRSKIVGEGREGVEERQQVVSALAGLAKDPYDRVQLLELVENLRGRNVDFDPLRVVRDLEKHEVIVEEDCQEYRFRNPLYWVIAREFYPATAGGTRV